MSTETGSGQSVAFEWNSRIHYDAVAWRASQVKAQQDAEAARARKARARLAYELERKSKQLQAEQLERQARKQKVVEVALAVGAVRSADEFDAAVDGNWESLETLIAWADELGQDLLDALDQNASADRSVAHGRPILTGISIYEILSGHALAGIAFGAIAAGAKTMSDDWKRAKASEYRAKWIRRLNELPPEGAQLFARIFAVRHPALASMLSTPDNLFQA